MVVGYNKGWKDSINFNKKNSQAFVYILLCKHEKYQGRRIKRGLFQSSVGKTVNADVNGALNIIRKVVGDSEIVSRIAGSGRLFRPIRVNVCEHIKTYE